MAAKKAKKENESKDNEENRRVRILVSSVVFGYEDFLESIYALLENFGYEVLMSHKGTIVFSISNLRFSIFKTKNMNWLSGIEPKTFS